MIKKSVKETLADKIAGVLNTAPVSFDPEDEDLDSTRAQLLEADLFDEGNDDEEKLLSVFRKQNVDLLSDVDPRYAGKKTSRKELADSDESFESDESSDEEESGNFAKNSADDESDEEQSDEEEEARVSEDDEESGEEEGNEDENSDEAEHDEETSDAESDLVDDTNETEDNFKPMNETDLSAQVKKGLCVRNQISMWENLLEMRIQLQKCLITANKMPQKQTFAEIKKSAGQEFSNQVAVTKNSLTNVLDKLLLLQQLVLRKYPETKNLDKNLQKSETEDEDEEVPSDTDDEKFIEAVEEEEEKDGGDPPKKKRKLNEIEMELSERYDKYKNYRTSVIQKWNEKTRIAVMKNNANSHSVINQIEHTLSDKTKLTKRTQLKRSEYAILGQESVENKEQENEENDRGPLEEYNTEIYDDDDFYHQLLRDLIEVKSADITDPVQLSRQWIQLQNLRSKMKRKVDTRATKGRKIRYVVHPKLVNFMAPIDENLWTDESKNELFSSLFGKRQRINIV